ncbi:MULTISPECIES: OmpP1/FadL family transporter [unclassified Rhizobium]|uniref:OmpP1/FadL family transporter n=1 Tax=unclassified Rhizobium TaxID=2613769 RepID=UPI0010D17648|nr:MULTISPECIES: OmpP1/FadL family transporter [unclassified Rhizobium]MBP2460922.1 long-chain fatty acid transport protein [Rhizobium sp. PvP014]MBP2528318.1 long-chain fatty acid transport protein [Rhizobium sp. PvP099]RYG97331.1 MAG: transporter [Alphaproteobacteria bacterium]
MQSNYIAKGAFVLMAGWSVYSPALAGGIERGGYNIDLLFDQSRIAAESTATFVMPGRKLKNVVDSEPTDGPLNAFGYSSSADETENFWSPRIGIKAGYENADCMFDYSQPYGAHTNPGENWAGAQQNIETKINSDNYALTCSYRFDAGPGQLRIIGGGSYLKMDGFKERLVIAPGLFDTAPLDVFGLSGSGVGRLDLEGDGWGWRAGLAYEIPEYAFRASLMYYSQVKLDDITGSVDLTNIPALLGAIPGPDGGPLIPGAGTVIPVHGSTAMPDALELKLQSGIAPDWLAFGSVKWTDWSQLQRIPFYNSAGLEVTSLDLGYRDGWTLTGGVGHKFNEQWSGAVSVTWDRGTSQEYGSLSDTWLFNAGVAYSPTTNVEIRLGGVLGILTGGDSSEMTIDGKEAGDEASYEYDSDLVAALSTSLKVKF